MHRQILASEKYKTQQHQIYIYVELLESQEEIRTLKKS